jgi:hypothetical protein
VEPQHRYTLGKHEGFSWLEPLQKPLQGATRAATGRGAWIVGWQMANGRVAFLSRLSRDWRGAPAAAVSGRSKQELAGRGAGAPGRGIHAASTAKVMDARECSRGAGLSASERPEGRAPAGGRPSPGAATPPAGGIGSGFRCRWRIGVAVPRDGHAPGRDRLGRLGSPALPGLAFHISYFTFETGRSGRGLVRPERRGL